jgi:hypothetical protein
MMDDKDKRRRKRQTRMRLIHLARLGQFNTAPAGVELESSTRITEAADRRVTESGDVRVTE